MPARQSSLLAFETIVEFAADRYLLMLGGWDGVRRVHGCPIHVDIIDGKIWIQRDGTERGVARDLIDAGVPRDQIVLAFQPDVGRDIATAAASRAMAIEAILFDADGVVQRQAADWRDALGKVLGSTGGILDDLLNDIFTAERPALTGHGDLSELLSPVLSRYRYTGSLEEALRVWTMIEVEWEIMKIVQRLRRTGMACCLATNQNSHRARHMSETLGYACLFDCEFYSCSIGAAKPDPAFFQIVLTQLGTSADRVLFLDDRAANVDAARAVGLHASLFAASSGPAVLYRTLGEFGIKGA